jgi:hypothetical protein
MLGPNLEAVDLGKWYATKKKIIPSSSYISY